MSVVTGHRRAILCGQFDYKALRINRLTSMLQHSVVSPSGARAIASVVQIKFSPLCYRFRATRLEFFE